MIFVLMYSYSSRSLIVISLTGYMHNTTMKQMFPNYILFFKNFLIALLQCLTENHKDWFCCNQSHLLFHSWAWRGIAVLASRLLLDKDQLNNTWNIYLHVMDTWQLHRWSVGRSDGRQKPLKQQVLFTQILKEASFVLRYVLIILIHLPTQFLFLPILFTSPLLYSGYEVWGSQGTWQWSSS